MNTDDRLWMTLATVIILFLLWSNANLEKRVKSLEWKAAVQVIK